MKKLIKTSAWQKFEDETAEIFRLFGYDIERNTKVNSAQTDLVATSANRFKPNILIECKYHESANSKVGIDEAENFQARLLKLRMNGTVDQGYLITNTDFTSPAKEAIRDSNSYIYFSRFDELVNQLVDVDYYLKSYIQVYEKTNLQSYLDLRIVDIRDLKSLNYEYGIRNLDGFSKSIGFFNRIAQSYTSRIRKEVSGRTSTLKVGDLIKHFQTKLESRRSRSRNEGLAYLSVPDPAELNHLISLHGQGVKEIVFSELKGEGPKRRSVFYSKLHNIVITPQDVTGVKLLALKQFDNYTKEFLSDPEKRLFILLADFGGGKSTSVAHLMYLLAKEKIDNPTNIHLPIPLLLSLRNYNKVPDIESLLINFFNTELGISNLNIPIFKKMNQMGKFVLLLDGFDEMARLVTPVERRLTFIEICKLIGDESKVVLASRPGYFPDNNELSEILSKHLQPKNIVGNFCEIALPDNCQIACLQLMDTAMIDKYIIKKFDNAGAHITAVLRNGDLASLAARPVLLNIIFETANELKTKDPGEITIRLLYDLYTKKWINREENKGKFRILVDSKRKHNFLILLAIQMQEEERQSIHFSELNVLIQKYFGLNDQSDVDHFSHDIRTCSFLSRNDEGFYSFIHKSFQEYFIALEFGMNQDLIYTGKFTKKFSKEIINFVDFKNGKLVAVSGAINRIQEQKLIVVKKQKYEIAAQIRDIETQLHDNIRQDWPDVPKIKSHAEEALKLLAEVKL